MGFAVCHVSKGSGSGGGLGNHIDREEDKKHSFKNADPNKLYLNKHYKVNDYCKMPLEKAIQKRIEDAYTGKRNIRKDAVKHLDHMLTGSHDQMKLIFQDEEASTDWIKANYNYISDNFGEENIVRFTLHLDERTPHIHCVTVPITDEGGLSAKKIVGNKVNLQKLQDDYAERMKQFGLERGRKNPNIKHQDTKEFYKDARAELNKRASELKKLETVEQGKLTNIKNEYHEVKSLLDDLNKNVGNLKTTEKIMTFLQPKKVVKSLEIENKELLYKLSEVTAENTSLAKKINSDQEGISMLKNRINDYAFTLEERNKEINKLKSVNLDKVSNKVAHTVVDIVNRELKKSGSKEVFIIYDGKVLTKEQKAKITEKNSNKRQGKGM